MKKSKFQLKVAQATWKRKHEQADNRRRAAWNRVGDRFGLKKQDLDEAKKSGLSPYRLIRDKSMTRDAAKEYIHHGRLPGERQFESWADYGVYLEIERLIAEAAEDPDSFPF